MKRMIGTITTLLVCFGTALAADAQWPLGKELAQSALKQAESSGGITLSGRYQVFVSPHVKGHTFMLDTESGRVWIMKKDNMSGDFSFQRVFVDQVDDQHGKATSKDTGKVDTKQPSGGK